MSGGVPLHVTIISASNLRAMDADGKSDPYVQLYLQSDADNKVKTDVINNNLNPEWNAEFDLVSNNPEGDALHVCMFDKDIMRDDRMIDEIVIPINEITSAPGGEYVFDKDCIKTDDKDQEVKESGHFKFTVKANVPEVAVQARDINTNENDECVFTWGDYGSTYSTDFTGYTDGEFESLGELTPDSQTHHHHAEPNFTSTEVKPKALYRVNGRLENAFGLINTEGQESNAYVTLQLIGKSAIEKAKGEQLRTPNVQGENPNFGFDFAFDNARKGDSILINAYQTHEGKEIVVGTIKLPIKDNEGEKEIALLRPKGLEENGIKGTFQSYGTLRLTIHSEKKNNFEP